MSDWPEHWQLSAAWPQLGGQFVASVHGSGLRLTSDSGVWHLKRRPVVAWGYEREILAQLDSRGVPVTTPEPTATGQRQLRHRSFAVWLYRELPGIALDAAPLVADARTCAEWFALGQTCGRLQGVLRALPIDELSFAELAIPRRRPSVAPSPTGVQLIHRDFHAGNVLFDAGSVSGYLDFDHLEIGPRLIDPVYASGSLLARLLEAAPDRAVTIWLRLWQQLVAGWRDAWQTLGLPVTTAELDASTATLIEIEHDFREWLADSGDQAGVALTNDMIALITQHSDAYLAAAHAG